MNHSFPVHVDAQTIECHEGNSINDNELVAPENFKTCDDGIKQCKVSGSKLKGSDYNLVTYLLLYCLMIVPIVPYDKFEFNQICLISATMMS